MALTFDLGLFSAQPNGVTRLQPQPSIRWPSNVPYIVDNLWEWQRCRRHGHLPRRRHAVYAWPRREMAENYASGKELVVYRIILHDRFKLCQVPGIPDSRNHPDCDGLRKVVLNILAQQGLVRDKGWTPAARLQAKEDIGRLWIPALTPEEIQAMSEYSEAVRHLLQAVEPTITYWKDFLFLDENTARSGGGAPAFDNGEIFFETEGAELRRA